MSKKIDRIEAKKKELEANLERLQSGLEVNLEHVKTDVTKKVNPSKLIREYPLPAVVTSIIGGLLLTRLGKKKPIKKESNKKNLIAESLGISLKKRLTKKATDLLLDYIEERFASNFSNQKNKRVNQL